MLDNERSAVDLAAAVRAGRLTATAVVEDYLAAIELDDPTIHAFNTVMADEAREAAGRIDAAVAEGRDPGPLAGVPVALKDNMCTRGTPTTCSSQDPRGLAAAVRRHGRRAPAGRRRRRHRQDQPRRVRDGFEHRELRVRPDPQPARPDPGAGWLQRRQRGRGGGRLRAGRAGQRHRRFDPPAGRALRCRRGQADLRRRQPLRARRVRQQPRPDRAVHADGRGRGAGDRR